MFPMPTRPMQGANQLPCVAAQTALIRQYVCFSCCVVPSCKDSHHLHICCLFRIRHAPWIANMGDLVAMFSSVKVKGTGDFGRQSCYCHADVHVASGIPSPSMPLEDKLCTG